MATKQDICKGTDEFVARAEALAARLSPQDWGKEVYPGGWNVKQVFCHLAATAGAAQLFIDMAKAPPSSGGGGGFDVDAMNARAVAARERKSPLEVLSEVRATCQTSVQSVELCSEEFLAKDVSLPWYTGALGGLLLEVVAEHGKGHLNDIEKALASG